MTHQTPWPIAAVPSCRVVPLALLLAMSVVTVGLVTAPPVATAADARQLLVTSPLTRIKALSPAQSANLQKAGIRSLAALAAASPEVIARTLKIDAAAAAQVVQQAKTELSRLNLVYSSARTKFRFTGTVRRPGELSPAEAYAQLIAPGNECTILVRKTCGLQNQCPDSPGCPVAKTLLERYNQETDKTATAESCLIALEDPVIFAQCP
jgi:hypothetical protein